MISVLLLHGCKIPHYRVPVYNHLSHYLRQCSFALTVTSEGIEPGNRTPVEFELAQMHLLVSSVTRLVWRCKFDVVMNRPDIGLILVGPDIEGVLDKVDAEHLQVGSDLRGQAIRLAVCGGRLLPARCRRSKHSCVTQEGDESAEINYLKHGVNGFVVPRGDVTKLAKALLSVLDDDELRGALVCGSSKGGSGKRQHRTAM